MKKITQREIKYIKNELWNKRMLDLPIREICIYVLYRIEELVKIGIATSYNEIRYNLCEVGPGKRRLDPWSLDIVIGSRFLKRLSNLVFHGQAGINFFANKNSPYSLINKIIKLKTNIINEVQKLQRSHAVQENLQGLIIKTVQRNNCIVSNSIKNPEDSFVECEIHHNKIADRNLLIRFYNTEEWVYPDSNAIWSLFKKAFKIKCIPILLAPHIHGSCFQLFKNLGMFARANYYLFMPDKRNKIIESITNPEEQRILDLSNFKFGRYESIKSGLTYGEFHVLTKLLSSTIPKYYDSFSISLEKMSRKLIPLLSEEFKEFVVQEKESWEINDRINSVRKFIALAKLGRVTELKKMIRRSEKLIRSLHYMTR